MPDTVDHRLYTPDEGSYRMAAVQELTNQRQRGRCQRFIFNSAALSYPGK